VTRRRRDPYEIWPGVECVGSDGLNAKIIFPVATQVVRSRGARKTFKTLDAIDEPTPFDAPHGIQGRRSVKSATGETKSIFHRLNFSLHFGGRFGDTGFRPRPLQRPRDLTPQGRFRVRDGLAQGAVSFSSEGRAEVTSIGDAEIALLVCGSVEIEVFLEGDISRVSLDSGRS
jgi:hypothetical protein